MDQFLRRLEDVIGLDRAAVLASDLRLDRPTVLTCKRNPVLVAQHLELKFNQRPQRRGYLTRRQLLCVHPLDALSDLGQRRPNQHRRIVLSPLQLLRRVLAAPRGKV